MAEVGFFPKYEQKQALLRLLMSDDLAELHAKSISKFNIFQALKIQNNEVKHSNFLGWLLAPFESHNQMDTFLKELLKVALKNETRLEDIILKDLTDAKVTLEKIANDGRRMDIFIDCPVNKLVCVIENKIWSGEGCNQLEDYRNYVLNHDKYKDYKYKIFLFLTPYKYSPCEDYKGYIRINYGDILKAINNLMKQCGCLLDNDIKIFIEHYKRMVERNIMGETDKEIVDLCRKIYRENKSAIDLIIENNDYKADVLSAMADVIKSRADLQEIVVENNGILALPNNLNNLNKLKYGEWQKDNIVYIHFINFAQGHKDACVEILVAPPKNTADNDKKAKLLAKIEEKTGLKFKGKDWNYTEPFNILTYEDCLNYENEQEIKTHIERKMEELKIRYIDSLRTALNEL